MGNRAKLLTILAAIGLIVSVYLTFKTYDPSTVSCSIGGGCETVLSSDYSTMFGIPVSLFGVGWYLVQFFLIYAVFISRKLSDKYLKLWVVGGLGFSLYLLGLEMFVIKAYCTWCLVSLAVVIATTLLVFWPKSKGVKS